MSDTIYNPFMSDTTDDTVTTMGVPNQFASTTGGFDFGGALSSFPFLDAAEMPQGYDIPNYLGQVGAQLPISSFFPGVQARPQYTPGLTDLTFTRGYYGPEEDVIPTAYGTESAGTRFWSGGVGGPGGLPVQTTTTATPQPRDSEPDYSGALGGLFGAMALAAASPEAEAERLKRLEAQRNITNITNTFTPTNTNTNTNTNVNTNTQTQTQNQQQSMSGGSQSQSGQNQGGTGGGGGTTTPPGGGTTTPPGGGGLLDQEEDDTVGGGGGTTTPPSGGGGGTTLPPDGGGLEGIGGGGTSGGGTTTPTPPDQSVVTPLPVVLTGNAEIIDKAYRDLLGRSAEPAALEYWGKALESGMTPDQLSETIIKGAQNEDRRAVEGRRATTAEERARFGEFLNAQDLNNPNLTAADRGALADIAYEQNPTAENLINNTYQNLFGRPADPAAIDFWKAQIDSGVSPEAVARRIAAGAQNEDRAALEQVDEAAWLAQNVPLPDIETPLKEAAANFARQNPGITAAGAAAVTPQFAEYLISNNPEVVKQLFQRGVDQGLLKPEAADALMDLGSAEAFKKAGELSASVGAESLPTILSELGSLTEGIPFANLVSAALSAENFEDFAGKAGAPMLIQAGANAIGAALGIPYVGQVVAVAMVVDSMLGAIGVETPIGDAVNWMARQITQGVEKVGEYVKKQTKNLGNPTKWSFQEGGLVDIGGDPLYSGGSEEVLPDIEQFAGGGVVPLLGGGKVAIGPGGGLDDLIPTSINGRRAAALSDGEFVIPADVVSMMGDGSSNAGSRRLYDLVKQIRQEKTGTTKQAGPLPVGKILERTLR